VSLREIKLGICLVFLVLEFMFIFRLHIFWLGLFFRRCTSTRRGGVVCGGGTPNIKLPPHHSTQPHSCGSRLS
jgi:hypothetical protein